MPPQPFIGQLDFDAVRCLSVSLAEKLDAYVQRHWAHQRDVALLYEDLVNRLISAGAGQNALAVGARLPKFILPDSSGRLVSSDELLGNGPLIVSFNRGHWCPFCRLELLSFAQIYPNVKELGADIISIMPDRCEFASKMKETYDLPFPVLSDIDNGYALSNGLMVSYGDELRQALLERGINLAAVHGNQGLFMPITATFVVGRDGIVKDAFVTPDFRLRMPPERVTSALKTFDSHSNRAI